MSPPTLPGDLPGLLQRGSPVVWLGYDVGWTVAAVDDVEALVTRAYDSDGDRETRADWEALTYLALDLSDPTGRAHAAWWWREHVPRDEYDLPVCDFDVAQAVRKACSGVDCPPDRIDTLRRACLAVAGRV